MKLKIDELIKIRSLANDNLRQLNKPKEMLPEEFVTYCWVLALSARLNLNITIDLPTRFKVPPAL